MTRYSLPPEPTAGTVWLTAPNGRQAPPEVWRKGAVAWHSERTGQTASWTELLRRGDVSDVHPELEPLPPLPWRVQWHGDPEADAVVDAEGNVVAALSVDMAAATGASAELLAFIAKAANARAAHLTGQPEVAPASDGWGDPLPDEAYTGEPGVAGHQRLAGVRVGPDEWVHPKGTPGRTIGELANALDDAMGNHSASGGGGVLIRMGGQAAWATELRWDGASGVFTITAGGAS